MPSSDPDPVPAQAQVQVHADLEAERAVLGALMLLGRPDQVRVVAGRGVNPESFYWDKHGQLFAAALALAERGMTVDPITIRNELDGVEGALGPLEIEDLTGYVPSAQNYVGYADVVARLALWRDRQARIHALQTASASRDGDLWDEVVRGLRQPGEPRSAGHLHLVDQDTGEQLTYVEGKCPTCDAMFAKLQSVEDQLKGAHTDIRGWRARYADLLRERERRAPFDPFWPAVERLFTYWKVATKRPRCRWSTERWFEGEPHFKRYGPIVFERAIAGAAFDPYKKARRNGTIQRFDTWQFVCKSSERFEECANRAPQGWKPTIVFDDLIGPAVEKPWEDKRKKKDKPQLALLEGGAEGSSGTGSDG